MNDMPAPYGLTGNGRPIPGGFTGSVPAFLDWLADNLACGGVLISEPEPDPLGLDRLIRKVELNTGGYSDDEELLGRVGRSSMFSMCFWESDHRGGLSIYHVPVEKFESLEQTPWLDEPTGTFETVARARTLVMVTPLGEKLTFELPYGAELDYAEPDRDICEPAGVLTVRATTEQDSPWGSLFSTHG